ncbi:MAG: hypothetical protein SFT68_03550 [Rickettsiaceae bacterium]|nr:hypothetical protein [Rickettsiaceae bacterium]
MDFGFEVPEDLLNNPIIRNARKKLHNQQLRDEENQMSSSDEEPLGKKATFEESQESGLKIAGAESLGEI